MNLKMKGKMKVKSEVKKHQGKKFNENESESR